MVQNRNANRFFLCVLASIAASPFAPAQSVLGGNLIVNGGAETGSAGTLATVITTVPGWTISKGANVLAYNVTGNLQSTDPTPPDHSFQYFASGPSNLGLVATFTQDIDVSSAATAINGQTVKFTASAFLGSTKGTGLASPAQVDVAFKNGNGQVFSTATLGPLGYNGNGMTLQQQIGLVPSGTVKITVTLTLRTGCENAAQCAYGSADSLSLLLTTLGTSPGTVLGTNQIANPGAESGSAAALSATTSYIPGWSNSGGANVAAYGGTGWVLLSDPGPVDRGVNLFHGGGSAADMYQDLDVSPAASLIDQSQVKYEVSAWLGGVAGVTSPTLVYTFFDWSGKQLAATAQLGPASHTGAALVLTSHSDTLPPGTRRVHINLKLGTANLAADNVAFVLAAPGGPPVITPGGVISAGAFGAFTTVTPGTWIEIYGMNLSSTARSWAGSDFMNGIAPTMLDNVGVSVGGKAAFVDSIGPGQVNALIPSDAPLGPTVLTVANANGTSDGYALQVNPTQPGFLAPPAFTIGGKQYVAALFPDAQTFALPTSAIPGVPSRPAKSGDVLTIYGIGFGPVNPAIPAGTVVTQSNSLATQISVSFGSTSANLTYYGLVPSFTGLYQFNVVVPAVAANNALPISFTLGGLKGSQTLYIAVTP
jgi:uncharacterized protein (TIGR03437 family)